MTAVEAVFTIAALIYGEIRLKDRTPIYKASLLSTIDDAIGAECEKSATALFQEGTSSGHGVSNTAISAAAREIEAKFNL